MTSAPLAFPTPQEQISPVCSSSVVCHCHKVTESHVKQAIEAVSAQSVEEIALQTRAGSSCRGCHCKLKRMLAGLSPDCGRFALCGQCGSVQALCQCRAA